MTQAQVDATYKVTEEGIYGFFMEHRWLSNYEVCKIDMGDFVYRSSEAAYMAEKTDDLKQKAHLASLSKPHEAKKYGQIVTIKPDWDKTRIGAMANVLIAKFEQNSYLAKKLLETGDKYLEETNWWNDTFWGVCRGVGENNLGKLLMMIRQMLREGEINAITV